MSKKLDEMGKFLSAIVAVDAHGAIGKCGALLCHLPADLKHFKTITMGHSIVMGRKTFESFPNGALPGRQNIVITRSRTFNAEDVTVTHSVDEAIAAATNDGEVFVIGGAQIYAAIMPLVRRLYLTVIDHVFADADAFFPFINPAEWQVTTRTHHEADDRNPFPFTFLTLERI